ncbi:hypothetical protein W97_09013 [Coniosporium apollinis CBS 100218]|uniref:Oxidoreductase n=1 Tax=Coniosporium apollinis (strain CBS 100218) TaxID=1168221 RepID=R7Z6D6_CONA1|nr:uncharacterized protein W97_09013 [Coniosporium apollinis CBS 100218]EON69750.1 hypothetical protein W97_09013 [Coniosporium apollinis CBS 100218]
MSEKRYNIAIIGYGLAAKIFHIPHILRVPSLNFYGIVQRHPTPDNDAQKDFPGIQSWRSSDEMLADSSVDVVIVTTLPESHFALTKAALEAGKHVVVEKPFVPTSEEATELCRLAASKDLILTVYQNRRYDADFLTLRRLLADNTLGRIVEFETHFDRHQPARPQTWRQTSAPGVSQIYDLGTHLLDQALVCFGLPKRITAFIGHQRAVPEAERDGYAADSFTVLLHYEREEGTMLVTAKAAVVSPEQEQLRCWVRGEKGSYKKCWLDVQEEQLHEGLRPGDEGFGVEPESRWGTLTTAREGKCVSETHPTVEPATYVEYYRVLAKALAGKGPVPVDPEQNAQLIRLVELAIESSKRWRTMDV